MACFTLDWIVQLLVLAVVVAVVYGIVMLVLPKIPLGEPWPTVVQIVRIVMWGIVAIYVIYFLANLVSCALGAGPIGLPRAR